MIGQEGPWCGWWRKSPHPFKKGGGSHTLRKWGRDQIPLLYYRNGEVRSMRLAQANILCIYCVFRQGEIELCSVNFSLLWESVERADYFGWPKSTSQGGYWEIRRKKV